MVVSEVCPFSYNIRVGASNIQLMSGGALASTMHAVPVWDAML